LTVTPETRRSVRPAILSSTYTITGYIWRHRTALTTPPVCSVSGAHASTGVYTIGCAGGSAVNYGFDEIATSALVIGVAVLTVTPTPRPLATVWPIRPSPTPSPGTGR